MTATIDYTKSDDWAVGMIGYELLCGRGELPIDAQGVPYDDAKWDMVMSARTRGFSAPEVCRAVVQGLLKSDIRERLTVGRARAMVVAARRRARFVR